jgi:Concanavalin A-like lectin/glucanases superfamily
MTIPPNPFGNSLQFNEVAYLDQLSQVAPPVLSLSAFMPSPNTVTLDGLTVELWFKAASPGSLVSVPMINNQATAMAPLMYIDTNGMLRAGLFDSTQITLIPGRNLIAQNNNGVINVGAPNNLKSPLSVVDGQWHHAALVVAPGSGGTQTLFLDGRLAASGTANGSFGLSFVAGDGTTWTANTPAVAQFGGSITPQPVVSAGLFQPYAQGFCGCINELRTWYGPRSASGIQQLIDLPLFDQQTYRDIGLAGYVGQSVFDSIQTTAYLVTTADTPPVDPFTDVTNRVPGYQNYGICTAIPFTMVALGIQFQPSQTYSTKISLCSQDQLQVSFPTTDANGDNLPQGSVFSMTLTNGVTGGVQTINQIAPGTDLTITAASTGCFRLDFTYSQALTIDNLQLMLVPGPLNSLMQLMLDVLSSQTAYTDPNYPITPTTLDDPRNPGQVTISPYWPLFNDQTAFPIPPGATYNETSLLTAYLNFNEAAQALSPQTSFTDFFNLGNSSIFDPTSLTNLLQEAYVSVTKKPSAPPIPPQWPFDSADDQIYAFILNVNAMRFRLNAFLTSYSTWAQFIVDEFALKNIPLNVANQIYNGQNQRDMNLNGPSTGDFIGSLLLTSAIIGLGSVLLPVALPAEIAATITVGTVALTAGGSAGANALSELIGSFWTSSTLTKSSISYSTLLQVINAVSDDTSAAYLNMILILANPAYVRLLYSNYGLLQALSFVNSQPLYQANTQKNLPDPTNNSLFNGITYASWKALIPAVFKWTPQALTNLETTDSDVVFQVTIGDPLRLAYQSYPPRLGIQQVLQSDPWKAFYWMLHRLKSWQIGTESRDGQFFSVCPIFYWWVSGPGPQPVNLANSTADWVIAWSLTDPSNQTIATATAAMLFGSGSEENPLSIVDQNNPWAAVGYGWYCPIVNAAVTTPFDAFMNWGAGVDSYSPGILVACPAEFGNLYKIMNGPSQVVFAAPGANDVPPPALVTLAPSVVNFGAVALGSTKQEFTFLTNNLQNALTNITATSDNPAFVVSICPTTVLAGQSWEIVVDFQPGASDGGLQTGIITFTSPDGLYESTSLTLTCSGVGF